MTAAQRRVQEVGCTLDLANTPDSLHAHVELDGSPAIRPGDRVLVHGAPTALAHGETLVTRRRATIERSSWVERLFIKIAAYFGLTGLLEIGFSIGRDR
ncbi:MAG: hypothetical protein LCH95_17515 [Proteobacteria bacterium]|nr:hypothetical protein [Pseudomonadota bacterium]